MSGTYKLVSYAREAARTGDSRSGNTSLCILSWTEAGEGPGTFKGREGNSQEGETSDGSVNKCLTGPTDDSGTQRGLRSNCPPYLAS